MNVLLTGGAGYIGSHIALLLLDQNYKVTIIDNLSTGDKKLIPEKAVFYEIDISEIKEVKKIISENKFDIVIHMAAFTRVGESVLDPEKYYLNNYKKAKIFFDTCISSGLDKIIFSSTGAVYGNIDKEKITESDHTNPLNPYAKSKLDAENYLVNLSKAKGIRSIILRYFNVAGSDPKLRSGLKSNPDNLIKAVCEVAINKREKLIINGNDYNTKDGTPIRDFIHVSDLAKIHYICAKNILSKKNSFNEIYNCGYGVGYSVIDVVKMMNSILNKKINVEYGKRREGDAKNTIADNSKFKKEFKWSPQYDDLKIILKTSLAWEKLIKGV